MIKKEAPVGPYSVVIGAERLDAYVVRIGAETHLAVLLEDLRLREEKSA